MAGWRCWRFGGVLMSLGLIAGVVSVRAQNTAAAGGVHLELSVEVATTDADENPTAIRIELRNVGESPVDLPPLAVGCGAKSGGVMLLFHFEPGPGNKAKVDGCAGSFLSAGTLLEQARRDWLRLQTGEYLVMTESIRMYMNGLGPGRLTYQAEYDPQAMSAADKRELLEAGFVFPEEKVMSPPVTVETQ